MTTIADELNNFLRMKQWYDLCLAIQKYSEHHTKDMLEAYQKMVINNTNSIHPDTFTDTTLILSNVINPQESQSILKMAIEILQSYDYLTDEMKNGILICKIRFHENQIYIQDDDEIGRFIYEIKSHNMNKKVLSMYYKLCYKYYESKGNFDEAFEYIDKFIYLDNLLNKESNLSSTNVDQKGLYNHSKEELAYKHIQFALLNTKLYSFTAIMQSPVYKHCTDENLNQIFINIMRSDIRYILQFREHIEKVLPGSYDILKDKVYLMAFINLCFYNDEKKLKIVDIQKHLQVDRAQVFYIVIKALGSNLIKGVIDGEEDVVDLDYVIPRVLNVDEVKEIKRKYENWKSKVDDIIFIMK